jgi:hypothetical protein
MPAYAVNDFDAYEPRGVVLFAKSNIEARRNGASDLDCDEIGGLSCCRAPWADAYEADGIIPASVMLANGWMLTCSGCDQIIHDGGTVTRWIENDAGDEEEVEIDVAPVGTQDCSFCTPECRDRELWRRAWMKRGARRCFEVFKRELLRLHPGVTVDTEKPYGESWSEHHHRYFGLHSKSKRGRAICFVVRFTWPGSKHGGSYRYDLGYEDVRGKRQVLIANGDAKAWREFVKS